MSTALQPKLPPSRLPKNWTLADLRKRLWGIPLERVRLVPPPGYATEEDVLELEAREDRLCELEEKLPRRPIPKLVPDFVVEVLSESNTPEEMDEKLEKYFQAGVRLSWYIDPESRSAKMYTAPAAVTEIDQSGFLDGGEVLPGFRLSLRTLFEEADRQGPRG